MTHFIKYKVASKMEYITYTFVIFTLESSN